MIGPLGAGLPSVELDASVSQSRTDCTVTRVASVVMSVLLMPIRLS